MADVRFEWDKRKDAANRRKHRVSFEEAATAFFDDRAAFMDDPDQRSGGSALAPWHEHIRATRLLVVSHCFRADDQVIRIISARRATRAEQTAYVRRWKK